MSFVYIAVLPSNDHYVLETSVPLQRNDYVHFNKDKYLVSKIDHRMTSLGITEAFVSLLKIT